MTKSKTYNRNRRTRKLAREFLHLLGVLDGAQKNVLALESSLKSTAGRSAAKRFALQVNLILDIVLLPYKILMYMEGLQGGLKEGLSIALQTMLEKQPGQEHTLGRVRKHRNREKQPELVSVDAMSHFFVLEHSSGVRSWLFATAVYTWTAFECTAGDLWEEMLNQSPTIGHGVLSELPRNKSDDGLSGLHIPVSLAAKFQFDLRRRLGTLLRSKFDFTSVDGIVKAYERAFGECEALEALSGELKELEHTRNLIVHRGGIVDERFLNVTKVKARRGRALDIRISGVTRYVIAVTSGAIGLLQLAESVSQTLSTKIP